MRMRPLCAAGVAALGAVLVFAASSLAAEPADVSGEWNAKVEIVGNLGTPTFVIKQDGDKLTGTYKGQFGEAELHGKVTGNEIKFSFELQPGAEAVYQGKLEEGKLTGTCDYAGQADGTWTAQRKKK